MHDFTIVLVKVFFKKQKKELIFFLCIFFCLFIFFVFFVCLFGFFFMKTCSGHTLLIGTTVGSF